MKKRNIAILGSTGSIGINTLKVADRYRDRFNVVALTAYKNCDLLQEQALKFSPKYLAATDDGIGRLKKSIKSRSVRLCSVERDLSMIASLPEVDVVILAMRGSAALIPFLAAVRAGKVVAPANKEALVIAGDILMAEAKKSGAVIIPIDSEQSAIFQCLSGQNRQELRRVHLTASGGALLRVPISKFDRLTVKQILAHPRWKMGPKITVDSATLMNKGFEVIEAQKLFGLTADEINVVVHPEAIIHSMVEFIDGSIMAQLAVTDMRLPIQYALTYPERLPTGLEDLDFFSLKSLNFEKPDLKKFPALALAFHAARKGGTLPCVLNAADEEAVDAFLHNRISFTKIYDAVERVVLKHKLIKSPGLQDILDVDGWAREETRKLL
ncbi:MAG: 1-deoxy-D-xylulose-5-phosphate reductoisomerase [Candidatus Omnitrophica bacterium]|nr:1-deoxy-D-xylulose-5-phosphate reductoisomerase [Candidatus Omnitrophota bacterium]